jgi:hypothetical protein
MEANPAGIPLSVLLFSSAFGGNIDTWNWICERSNGRQAIKPYLTKEQEQYAYNVGYITSDELVHITPHE